MKFLVPVLFAILPSSALADFSCTLETQCGMDQCAPFGGDPVVLHEAGDTWQVNFGGQVYDGYVTTSDEGVGELSIVIPPQASTSGLISLYESGTVMMTFHAMDDSDVIAITGYGSCVGTGG